MRPIIGFLIRSFEHILLASLGILGALSIAGFFGQFHTVLEALSNFRVFYTVSLFTIFSIFLLLKRLSKSAIALVLVVINGLTFTQFYVRESSTAPSASVSFRLLELNVFGGKNSHWQQTIDVINQQRPDIIGISETTATWAAVLRKEMTEYPYQLHEPRFGGVSLLSKFPLQNSHMEYFGEIKRPRISTDVLIKNQLAHIVFMHPVIPLKFNGLRDQELMAVAEEVKTEKRPVIVFGDLNITPWCYHFERLLEVGKLRDTERGFGFQPTWNAWFLPLFPIDHCLTTREFVVTNHQVLQNISSDHLPVLVDVKFIAR